MRRLIAFLLAVAPFVAGAIAALGARRDARMLGMAAAATLAARVVLTVAAKRRGAALGAWAAFAASALAASAVAVLAGARGAVGVAMVAAVLAGCATAGAALGRRPRPAV